MPNHSETSDTELIAASRNGDTAAFGLLVTRYQSLACSVAYNRCGDLAASEDFAQEAFLKAWKSLASLRDTSSFKSWLCTIVRNLAARSATRRTPQSNSGTASLDSVNEPADDTDDPARIVLSAEQNRIVWQALAEIPENYREPLILYYREDKSVARVAEALDISVDAAKQRLARGRKMLHQHMIETVENALESTKPSPQFAGVVIAGLSASSKVAVTTGGTAATATASVSATNLFWLPLAKLPLLVWLLRVALDETRSEREREMLIRHQVLCFLGVIPMFGLMIASIYLPDWTDNPTLQEMTIPGILVLYYIPMIWSFRRLSVRIEQLRIDEKTATPPRDSVLNESPTVASVKYFLGSSLIVAVWPALLFALTHQWNLCVVSLGIAALLGAIGFSLRGSGPERALKVYAVTLGLITLSMIAFVWMNRSELDPSELGPTELGPTELGPTELGPTELGPTELSRTGSPGISLLGFGACMQAMAISYTLLLTVAWRRVHGKPQDSADEVG